MQLNKICSLVIVVFSFLFANTVQSAVAGLVYSRCKVIKLGGEYSELNCNPELKKNVKTPSGWLPKEKLVKVNDIVELKLNHAQLGKWLALNEKNADKAKVAEKANGGARK